MSYFELGEEIILQCREYPEYNGVYSILDIDDGYWYVNEEGLLEEGFCYKLEGIDYWYFHEKWIKKKHESAKVSFKSLLVCSNKQIMIEDM